MKQRIETLRKFIREEIRKCMTPPAALESYDHELSDDPSYGKKSVLVPDDIKDSIDVWMFAMGLNGKRRRGRGRV